MRSRHCTSYQGMGWLAVGGLVLLMTGFYLVSDVTYAGRIFPGVRVGQTKLGGQTLAEATQSAKGLVQSLRRQQIVLETTGFSQSYLPRDFGLVWAPESIAQAAFQFGRSSNVIGNLAQRLRAMCLGVIVPVTYQEQLNKSEQVITQLKRKVNRAGIDGDVIISQRQATIKPAIGGRILDSAELSSLLERRWQMLDFTPLTLPINESPPVFNDELTQITADKINQSLAIPYLLVLRDREIKLPPNNLWEWVEVVKQRNSLVVHLRPADLAKYVEDLKIQVDQLVQDANLTIKDGKVIKFQPDQLGINLQVAKTAEAIQTNLLTEQHRVEVAANYIEPRVKLGELNNLGISELVARGESNFTGSPKNRRHNIKIGAAKFDKVLVAPGTTFSFNKVLGEVNETTGYLPELVIKGDETTPEFGGGLCQVSTTAFRAALNGGYPILARQNHSYRVSYYEPAGTDATVYQPYPDMQFKNDTADHILIHTYVDGDNLYFDFYGTKAGRRVELDGPRIFNITEPPSPVYVETSTLPEGEEKKIDTAHRGADTILYRYVYNANGKEVRKDIFKSHYVPWPAKYLVGAKTAPKVETNLGNVPPETTAVEATSPDSSPKPIQP